MFGRVVATSASLTQRGLRDPDGPSPQDVYLFNASVAENLRLGDPTPCEEDVRSRPRTSRRSTSFIDLLPEGFSTILGERGVSISAGQRQRLAIARALLRDAPILVMDEAVANLDAESEAALRDWEAEGRARPDSNAAESRTAPPRSAPPTVSWYSITGGSSRSGRSTSSWREVSISRGCSRPVLRPSRSRAPGSSVGEERNPKPFVTPEEHTTRDCGRSESFMQAVEGRVDRRRRANRRTAAPAGPRRHRTGC